jgi:hypothetical protein
MKITRLLAETKTEDLPSVTFPGGYPLYYLDAGGKVLCPECARENDEYSEDLTDYDINWEDDSLYCDHCSESIESAYGNDD